VDVTNRFVLDFAAQHGGRILDYGCGAGDLVFAGRAAGLDLWGADVFYAGSTTKPPDSEFIREIKNGRIPFPDAEFDLVTNNQVMEHVEDLDAVLAEIARVLKRGGSVLSVFPSRDVWREGHIGIPFSHRFRKDSKLRFYYTWGLRLLGAGTWKEQAPTARRWAIDKLGWIDTWTRYRSRAEIFRTYDRYFHNDFCEPDYIRYRLLDRRSAVRRALARTTSWPVVADLQTALFRKLAFLVIVSRKK
jgi:SAM-dependent methyltransferase